MLANSLNRTKRRQHNKFEWFTYYTIALTGMCNIALFISITMLRGTDIMLWIIPPFELNMKNIPHTIVNPVGNCYESLNNVMELLDPMSTSKPFEIYTTQIPELATAICGRSETLLKFWLSVISVWIDAQGSRIISDLPGFVGPTIYNTLQRKLNNLMQMFCHIGFQFWIKFEYGQSKKPW